LVGSDLSQRIELFSRSVFPAALSGKTGVQSLLKYIKQKDPTLTQTRALWMSFTTFCEEQNLLYTLFEVHVLRNSFDEAALTALDLFHREELASKQLAQLMHAQFCLSESLHYRTNPGETTTPPFRPKGSENVDSIRNLITLTEFLQSVVEFCMQRQVRFLKDYNILKSGQTAVSLAALLLVTCADALLEKLSKLIPVNMKDVTAKAGELLAELPLTEILRDMKDLVALRPQLARELNSVLLKKLALGDNRPWITTIILTCWEKAEDQCVLLLEYDYLMEGFQTALAAKQQHLVPLVAFKASLIGNLDLVRSCEKLLA
jgi:hypothetical protein